MNKTAIIIRGPAAVGKSTVAALLHEQIEHSAHIDVDLLKRMISQKSSIERTEVAHEAALSFVGHLASRDFSIIIEELFREDDLIKLKTRLTDLGYRFLVIFLGASVEELVKRDAERIHKIKGFEVISRLHSEVVPFAGDVQIDVTGLGPDEIVGQILQNPIFS